MIPLAEAQERLEKTLERRRAATQKIPVADSAGRVLAQDVVSRIDIPPFDRVMMDGYAIPPGPQSKVYKLAGAVPAGSESAPELKPGTAMKVMTGAAAPPGTGRVAIVENCRERDGWVEILDESTAANVAPRGEDLAAGKIVLRAGCLITPARTAGLAACGAGEVEVFRRPRATVIATGDELTPAGADLPPGGIHDANTPLLSALLRERGYEVETPGSAIDDPDSLRESIAAALDAGDLTVLSGGVSMGDRDFVPGALRDLGLEIVFDRVLVKPGKPMTLAAGERGVALALPGNPVSAFVSCHLYVLPALAMLEGRRVRPRFITATLADDLGGGPDRRLRLLPARLDADGRVRLPAYHNSGHLHSLLDAEGLVRVEAEADPPAAGDEVPFWPLRTAAYAGDDGND